ncbi:MAG: hypothetical protein KKD31_06790 [Bacteroidetes bacterium]|nr:hypothetical protein [Bacteroidota bacterium]
MNIILLLIVLMLSIVSGSVFSQTVYTTKTGTKYHKGNCRYLSKGAYEISLPDAISQGYTPCSVCKPNSQANSTTVSPSPKTYTPSGNSLQSVRCSATTKAGSQCSRMTKSPNRKCWQHGGD